VPGADAADEGLMRLEVAEIFSPGHKRLAFKKVSGSVFVAGAAPYFIAQARRATIDAPRVSDERAKYQPREVVHSVSTPVDWTAGHQRRQHGTYSS
jgi:hypothetical protein